MNPRWSAQADRGARERPGSNHHALVPKLHFGTHHAPRLYLGILRQAEGPVATTKNEVWKCNFHEWCVPEYNSGTSIFQ